MPCENLGLCFHIHFYLKPLAIVGIHLLNPKFIRAIGEEECAVILIFLFLNEHQVISIIVIEGAACII
jgi:hypothetical protein